MKPPSLYRWIAGRIFLQEKTETYLLNSIRTVVLGLPLQLLTLPQIVAGLHNPKIWHVFLKKNSATRI